MPYSFLSGIILGFIICFLTTHDTHPKSLKRKVPKVKFKNIELTPSLKIHFRGRYLWLHHWLTMSLVYFYITLYAYDANLTHNAVQGFLLGGATQGLTYKDRFKLLHRNFQS